MNTKFDIKAPSHEAKHVEWKPLLSLMHLVTSFLNRVPHLEYNPTQWKGKTSTDFSGTQLNYIPASFQLVVCIK